MGGSGVQRPLKFIKFMREQGWNPIVLCPEPGAYHTFDESLQEELESLNIEVHRVEGNTPFHSLSQQKREVNISDKFAKILRWCSSFFYLPDNKVKWVKSGLKKALELIETEKIDLIFSTAPPYSNLMLASQVKQKTGLPVVMDLRDDWLGSHLINYPTPWHKRSMQKIESATLGFADSIITINDKIAGNLQSRTKKNVEVIGHGYDPDDFNFEVSSEVKGKDKLKFLYSGSFYPDSRPDSFLLAMHSLLKEDPVLEDLIELYFQGGLNTEHKKLISKLNLENVTVDYGYLSHKKAVQNLMQADVLWLNVGQKKNKEIISLGKTSEYFATKKPILGLVPDGSAKELLQKYGKSFIADPYDTPGIKHQIREIIKHHKNDDWPKCSEKFVVSFDRRELTKKLVKIFNEISVP